ncbi:PREDICTED: peptidyl-prolyl cis-trans isomerase, rhodopsin-specific isozyme [Nicrophorus vespilloides]|uniref:Peptidyl-prolyl cis-trans isomerase n=1 Tax=Nicrophorus vespilloides TaxID=110193 RepID=A0ABM1M999_NICVS|nr:PREDICTED: peptidyl-prolyl cis-trans isomerase, rhodopsin-specific isozyme [Nicrophorus vespilloides]
MELSLCVLILVALAKAENYKVTDRVYLDVEHGGEYVGKIVIGLFGEIAPKTVNNFKILATQGIDGNSFEGSTFHRVIQRFMIQGGDVLNRDGSSSVSAYGGLFEDENFIVPHNSAGFVSMANNGPNTNGCQFFITTIATNWLDGYHTVFGKVVKGQEIVHTIEHFKTDSDDRPLETVRIIQSGIMETPKPYFVSDDPYDYSLWLWIRDGSIPLSFSFAIMAFFHWVIQKLDGYKLI